MKCRIIIKVLVAMLCSLSGFCAYSDAFAEGETVVNSYTQLRNAALDPSISKVKLGKDISFSSTITWTLTDTDRELDLGGHTITSTASSPQAVFVFEFNGPSATSGNTYSTSLNLRNGSIIQKESSTNTSQSVIYFRPSGRMNPSIYMKDVNVTASTHHIQGILQLDKSLNQTYKRYLEIDGGVFDGGNLIYVVGQYPKDRIKLKRLKLAHSDQNNPTTSIFFSSQNLMLSSIIDSTATVFRDASVVTDLTGTNLSNRGTIYIKARVPSFTVRIEDWTEGASANQPATEGNISGGEITYLYSIRGSEDWSDSVPTGAGEYTLKAILDATDQYLGAEATDDFVINAAAITPETEPESESESDSESESGIRTGDDAVSSASSLAPDTGGLTGEQSAISGAIPLGIVVIFAIGGVIAGRGIAIKK